MFFFSSPLSSLIEGAAETSQAEVHQKAKASASRSRFPARPSGAHSTLATPRCGVDWRPESRQEDGLLLR